MKVQRLCLIIILCLGLAAPALAQESKGQWCGYALIEGVPGLEKYLQILSLITPEEKADTNPYQLFQSRISLDGTKAIVEGCWKIYPSRDVIMNLFGLVGMDAKTLDSELTYSIFAPDKGHEDSAASVRYYLEQNRKEWEPPCDDPVSC